MPIIGYTYVNPLRLNPTVQSTQSPTCTETNGLTLLDWTTRPQTGPFAKPATPQNVRLGAIATCSSLTAVGTNNGARAGALIIATAPTELSTLGTSALCAAIHVATITAPNIMDKLGHNAKYIKKVIHTALTSAPGQSAVGASAGTPAAGKNTGAQAILAGVQLLHIKSKPDNLLAFTEEGPNELKVAAAATGAALGYLLTHIFTPRTKTPTSQELIRDVLASLKLPSWDGAQTRVPKQNGLGLTHAGKAIKELHAIAKLHKTQIQNTSIDTILNAANTAKNTIAATTNLKKAAAIAAAASNEFLREANAAAVRLGGAAQTYTAPPQTTQQATNNAINALTLLTSPFVNNPNLPPEHLPYLRSNTTTNNTPTPELDNPGFLFFTAAEGQTILTQASTAYIPNIPNLAVGPIGPNWPAIAFNMRQGILNACIGDAQYTSATKELQGSPIIQFHSLPGGAANRYGVVEETERVTMSYIMGSIGTLIVALKANYTFVMHLELFEAVVPDQAGISGNQYVKGAGASKPDFMACDISNAALHILEAKGSASKHPLATGAILDKLTIAMDQCLRYESFLQPIAGIQAPATIGVWGPSSLLFPKQAGGGVAMPVHVYPSSRVATLTRWTPATNRWEIYATDPNENVAQAPPEFTDGYLRLYYAQYKPMYDHAASKDKATTSFTYKNQLGKPIEVPFEFVNNLICNQVTGIDARILNKLKNEPAGGYPPGELTKSIVSFTNDYPLQSHTEKLMYVSKEGVYSCPYDTKPTTLQSTLTDTIKNVEDMETDTD